MTRPGSLIELNNVEITFDPFILVVKGISIKLPRNGIVALLGANGAGKSTVLKGISGVIRLERGRVTKGYIEYDGRRIENLMPEIVAKMGITYVHEGRKVFEELTVEEDLLSGLYGRKTKDPRDALEMVYNFFPRLKERRKVRSGLLSGGEQQMLVIGRALISRPRVLLLDEPSLGLAPKVVSELFRTIRMINEHEDVAILLAEQNVKKALEIADYGYVIENGRIVLDGPADKIINNPDVQNYYLGIGKSGRISYQEIKSYKRRKRWIS
ncbi:MAG TPA: ABC transporter ATP-binding protein [Candidatus Caldiarchaeum subterraneum]|uniref:ABC transporter ATP-binding protein n=1 Tax=Caldiarchaeum subterraneum TaxID=311458 RepID=A0A833A5A5_CALS0|nr:ABC transporter ATP-binding protein [Candidatus Caldarchaeum subterraneum]